MPVHVTKTDGKYRVSTPGGVKSKGSTMRNAMAQKRLLQGVEHGWKPTGKPAKRSSSDHMMKKTAMMMRAGGHRA